jgi:hypothetical protein
MLLRTIILIIPFTPLALQATLHLGPDPGDGPDLEFVGGFRAYGDDLADDLVTRADPVVLQRTPASGDGVHVRAADCETREDTEREMNGIQQPISESAAAPIGRHDTKREKETRTSAVFDGNGDIPRSGSLEFELLDGELGVLAGIRDTVSSVASSFESVIERKEETRMNIKGIEYDK